MRRLHSHPSGERTILSTPMCQHATYLAYRNQGNKPFVWIRRDAVSETRHRSKELQMKYTALSMSIVASVAACSIPEQGRMRPPDQHPSIMPGKVLFLHQDGKQDHALVLNATHDLVKACNLVTGEIVTLSPEAFGSPMFNPTAIGHPNCMKAARDNGLHCEKANGRCFRVPGSS